MWNRSYTPGAYAIRRGSVTRATLGHRTRLDIARGVHELDVTVPDDNSRALVVLESFGPPHGRNNPYFLLLVESSQAADVAWLRKMNQKIPASETKVRLFNFQSLDGWQGQKDKYWTVQDATIIGKNTAENAPKASTYLVTDKPYKNFRLIFESKCAGAAAKVSGCSKIVKRSKSSNEVA